MKPTTPAKAKARKRKPKYATWEHPEGSGIKISEIPNRTGGQAFGFSYQVRIPGELLGQPNKRQRYQCKTKADAERLAEDRFMAMRLNGTEFAKIPPLVQKQAAIAWGILNEHNQRTGLPLDFIDVVKAGIRTLSPAGGRKTVSEVVAELLASKTERLGIRGIDPATVHDFKIRCGKIEATFGERYISDILHTEIADWLRTLKKNGAQFGGPLSARSVKNYRNILSEVFRHATARQYCTENPFDRFTREDLKALGGNSAQNYDDVNVLTPDEARKLLEAAHASNEIGMLASTVLRLFCGIRTTEVCRLDWQEVRWLDEKPIVLVPASKAKKRRIRDVPIPENALAWLRLCNPPASGQIVPGKGNAREDAKIYCARFGRVAKAAGIGRTNEAGEWQSEWESNDTRHSFGSYHFALHGDSMLTAKLLGHKQNDDVLFTYYRKWAQKTDAEAYFAIRPAPDVSNVTEFPKAATA